MFVNIYNKRKNRGYYRSFLNKYIVVSLLNIMIKYLLKHTIDYDKVSNNLVYFTENLT